MPAYYNEIDPFAAQWLRELIKEGHIADGEVDERSIEDVRPDELAGFTQCHFFAGIGGWSYAARLAGWPDERPLWTGSCPCQPFSVAGQGRGDQDERHLWPEFKRLIEGGKPSTVFGEQVAGKAGVEWATNVERDFEEIGYDFGFVVLPASAFGVPQTRERIYFAADTSVSNAAGRSEYVRRDWRPEHVEAGLWQVAPWKSGNVDDSPVDDGLQPRLVKSILKGLGNAIVPQVAAEIIRAYMETKEQ